MKLKEFAELVQQLREAQETLLRERSPQWLSTAKELERRVDAAVKTILDGQGKLF